MIRSYVRAQPAFLVLQTRGVGARAWIRRHTARRYPPVNIGNDTGGSYFPVQTTSSFPQKARFYFSKSCVAQLNGSRPRVKVRGSLGMEDS